MQKIKIFRREIGKDTGYKVIAGDFNFTMNPALDKEEEEQTAGQQDERNRKRWKNNLGLLTYGKREPKHSRNDMVERYKRYKEESKD